MRNGDEVDRGSPPSPEQEWRDPEEAPKATLFRGFVSDEDVEHERDLLNDVGGDGGGIVGARDDGRALEQPGLTGREVLPGEPGEVRRYLAGRR